MIPIMESKREDAVQDEGKKSKSSIIYMGGVNVIIDNPVHGKLEIREW